MHFTSSFTIQVVFTCHIKIITVHFNIEFNGKFNYLNIFIPAKFKVLNILVIFLFFQIFEKIGCEHKKIEDVGPSEILNNKHNLSKVKII